MKILKNTLILCLITLLAGGLLAVVYEITKVPIAAAELEAENAAYREVCSAYQYVDLEGEFDLPEGFTVGAVKKALDSKGKLVGYVVKVSGKGYGGEMQVVIGTSVDLTITGVKILSHAETPGLGANATLPAFTNQFKGIAGGKVSYTKSGKTQANEIDALSGATVTTKGVTEAVNTGLDCLSQAIEMGE